MVTVSKMKFEAIGLLGCRLRIGLGLLGVAFVGLFAILPESASASVVRDSGAGLPVGFKILNSFEASPS